MKCVRTFLLPLCALSCFAQTAKISGTVQTPDKKPAKGIHILASGPGVRNFHTMSGKDGTFAFNSLADGMYSLCVQGPGSDYLDSCQWSQVVQKKTQDAAPVQLTLQQGIRLNININDPGKYLSANEGKTKGAHLLVGVWSGNLFIPTPVSTSNASGRMHSLIVPKLARLRATAFSKFYKIGDAKGAAFQRSSSVPVIAGTTAPTTVTFTILGK